jgi:hypothetical protein
MATTNYTDGFTRANENPLGDSGAYAGYYTKQTTWASGDLQLYSNRIHRTVASQWGIRMATGHPFTPDSAITYITYINSDSNFHMIALMNYSNNEKYGYYYVQRSDASAMGGNCIARVDNGSATVISSYDYTNDIANGSWSGGAYTHSTNTVRGYINASTGSTAVDATYLYGGLGFGSYSSLTTTGCYQDNLYISNYLDDKLDGTGTLYSTQLTETFSDDFNRASIGSNWEGPVHTAPTAGVITSSAYFDAQGATWAFSASACVYEDLGSYQYAEATPYLSTSSAVWGAIATKCSYSGTGTGTGIWCIWNADGSVENVYINIDDAGAMSHVPSVAFPTHQSTSVKTRILSMGPWIGVWTNTSGAGWVFKYGVVSKAAGSITSGGGGLYTQQYSTMGFNDFAQGKLPVVLPSVDFRTKTIWCM